MPTELDKLLARMKAEPPAETAERARWTFDNLARPFVDNFVLFGAGPLGKLMLRRLQQAGVEPVAFADNNQKLWGTRIEGIEVFSRPEAVERFGKHAAFVVTVYNGAALRKQLRNDGCQHVVPFAALWWKYADAFLPDLGVDLPQNLLPQEKEIQAAYELVADEASRKEILDQLRWRFWLDDSEMSPPLPARDTYFPNELIAPPPDGEAYVDCGAFDGASIRDFLAHAQGPVRHIYATEPDPGSRELLAKFGETLPPELQREFTVWPYALGSAPGTVRFAAVGDVTSKVGSGELEVECRTFDDLPWSVPPTYIKMDIEGAEPDAIRGGKKLWNRDKPVIVACLYHRSEHLWQIPLLIHELAPEYRLYLRRYAEENWETVCYAVPPARVRP
ncbi:MAG TPA: FkbM family methyltransferase [Candidatus Koribacter sp.]|jgi:FkbM family methyltransferase